MIDYRNSQNINPPLINHNVKTQSVETKPVQTIDILVKHKSALMVLSEMGNQGCTYYD